MNLSLTFSEADFDSEVLARLKFEAIKRGISLESLLIEIASEKAREINAARSTHLTDAPTA